MPGTLEAKQLAMHGRWWPVFDLVGGATFVLSLPLLVYPAQPACGSTASARELCDRLGQCEVESPWTREDAVGWLETRLEPERRSPSGD